MDDGAPVKIGMKIMRAKDAPDLNEAKRMSVKPFSPLQREGMNKLMAEGYGEGAVVAVLCDLPGFSLIHSWMKHGYPLLLHSHDSDCLYYVIAGEMSLGTETLGPRDSVFMPAGTPYTFAPGVDGVEFLEFRHANAFDFVNLAKGEAFWTKALDVVKANADNWRNAVPPSAKVKTPA
jgi:mannose-6-phosphate isomerase-like protein (cupin superfamily)